ncbi:isopenicillin N synthase family dioxygenase [Legionella sp. D16C41]|uniref:isopenicillin N synthase family dioxygenase n=1 Tax=Legionella sp. D16C41 TaxID=3402688 RepID=UPI003AF4359C
MIPTIDLDPLFSNKLHGLEKVASQIYAAYSTYGFGQIINHRVPQQIIKDIYTASKNFQQLPFEEKIKIRFKKNLRGFLPVNSSTLKITELGEAKKSNQSESFVLLNDIPKDSPEFSSVLGGEQLWPTQLPEFKKQVLNYYSELKKLSKLLIRAFSVALDYSPHYLDQYFREPNALLRLLSYPPKPSHAPSDLYGSAPHTDYGCITLLHQDNSGGLQILTDDNKWLDVLPREDSFVLNTGHMMTIWSNGKLKATKHRVINKSNHQRFSIPFFYNCSLDVTVSPLSKCVSSENPAHVESVHYGDFIKKILLTNYTFQM